MQCAAHSSWSFCVPSYHEPAPGWSDCHSPARSSVDVSPYENAGVDRPVPLTTAMLAGMRSEANALKA